MEIQIKPFAKVLDDSTRKFKKIPKRDYLEEGLFPIIDQSKKIVAGYTNNENIINSQNLPVIIFGDHTKAIKYIDFPLALGADGAKALTVKSKDYYSKYCYYALKSLNLPDAGYSRHFKFLKESKIPVPKEIDEQKRIAQVLTDCEAMIAQRKESIALLDELLKSTFLEMFGDPLKNEKGWKTTQLKNLGDFKNGLNFSKNEKGHTIKSLGVSEFKRLSTIYETKSLPTINVMKYPSKDYFLKNGDLVFVRSNGNRKLVGRCIAIYPNDENVTFSGFCIRFRPESEKLNSIYLTYLFKIESFKNRMLSKGRGANITNLNQTILGNLKILLPPVDTQKHFEHKVHKIESLIRLQKQHLKQLQNLYGRLSQDAFKGELDLSKVVLREEFLQEAIKKETSEKSEPTYDQKTLFNIKKIDTYFEHFLKNNFQEKSFVFEDVKALLFEDIRTQYNQYDYDKWKKQFFNILNKKNSFIEQYFEEEEGALKFKLKHETD